MTLDEAAIGRSVMIRDVGGDRAFRRRLMEIGLTPGTAVEVRRVAPLGDPLELHARGAQLSIRRKEARELQVVPTSEPAPAALVETALVEPAR